MEWACEAGIGTFIVSYFANGRTGIFFIISSHSPDDEVIVTSFLKITKTIMVFLFKKLLNYYFKVAKNME